MFNSDPTPFQWLGQRAESCRDTIFIDVDYGDLMKNKVNIIEQTPELADLLEPARKTFTRMNGRVLFAKQNYIAVGCDLGDGLALKELSQDLPWLQDSAVLFVAEVSITYMDISKADHLLEWCSSLGKGNSLSHPHFSEPH